MEFHSTYKIYREFCSNSIQNTCGGKNSISMEGRTKSSVDHPVKDELNNVLQKYWENWMPHRKLYKQTD